MLCAVLLIHNVILFLCFIGGGSCGRDTGNVPHQCGLGCFARGQGLFLFLWHCLFSNMLIRFTQNVINTFVVPGRRCGRDSRNVTS